jgi:hypothetical protein
MSDLVSATGVAVVRHPGFLWVKPSWGLLTSTGEDLGSVVRQPGGNLILGGHLRYVVAGPAGDVLWLMDQYSSFKLSRFVVLDQLEVPVGEVLQENALFAPQFRLTSADGAVVRLDGGRNRSWAWTLQDLAGQPLGSMTRQPSALTASFFKERTYLVERGEGLGGGLWPLAMLSCICLDIVHERKQEGGG